MRGFHELGLLHGDPHPGNFRLLDDGRMGVLDFGSVLVMPGGLPPTFGGLIRAMTATDPAAVERRLREEFGFVGTPIRLVMRVREKRSKRR